MDATYLPSLHPGQSADSISELWKQNIDTATQQHIDECDNGKRTACTFAWVAMRKEDKHRHISDNPTQLMIGNFGTEVGEWMYDTTWPPVNYGLKPKKETGAIVDLIVPGQKKISDDLIDVNIEKMSITYMKSYSKNWIDTKLHIAITHHTGRNNDTEGLLLLGSGDYSGYHEIKTSEYYTEVVTINGHQPGQNLNATLQMSSGNTFKIIALTFCGTIVRSDHNNL